MTRALLFFFCAVLLCTIECSAEMYRYVDDQGALHFVDELSQVPKKHRGKAQVAGDTATVSYSDAAPAVKRVSEQESPRTVEPRKSFNGTVELYVTSWCPYCRSALKFMQERGIPYVAYDIEKDAAANQRYKEHSGRGVPLIVVGDKVMRGFDAATLEKWLGR